MAKITAIRGMNDILPQDTPVWEHLESTVRTVLQSYGYQEIRLPLLEQTALFKRSIGEVTDIVEKEMYTFADRNGDSLTLRPEGTASCVRAGEEHGLFYNQRQRLWYSGPMFRYERPQKGRYRQFHQVGVEAFGMEGPDIDAEIILVTAAIWRQLGIINHVKLQLNSLGTSEDRAKYKEALTAFLSKRLDQLDEDSQRRLHTNPLRILDSKNSRTQELLADAPNLMDYIDEQSREHFQNLCAQLDTAGINYEINPRLVRGLDYYCKTVFEWITDELGAQGTVCAGGRYDGLVEQLGGRATPAVGFAMGLERLVLMLRSLNCLPPELERNTDVYLVAVGEQAQASALILAEQLRQQVPGLRLVLNCGVASFKTQMKRADKSGAIIALILGDDEVKENRVSLKYLRDGQAQVCVARDQVASTLSELLR